MKHFGCIQSTPSCSVLEVWFPAQTSQLTVGSSFHPLEGLCSFSTEMQELRSFLFSVLLWCSSTSDSISSGRRHSPAGGSTHSPSLHHSRHSHLWQTASHRRMFSLFPWSQHGCSHENTPECFMSPCRRQRITTRHKSCLTEASPKRGSQEMNDEDWQKEGERKMWIFSTSDAFVDVLFYADCSLWFNEGWRPWTKEWFLLNYILLNWKSMCENPENHKDYT